ncbi:MAG: exodeoxyribonuclease VII large subunit, partial [Gammaproteobacteria bacterium]|nr:exodeoxyribonuclease VII large subunit [Gammaproteobacteria bacterium]
AELVTPDRNEQLRMLDTANQRLAQALRQLQENFRERLNWCDGRLQQLHPARLLRDRAQRLDEMETRLRQVLRTALQARNAHLKELQARLRQHSPVQRLALLKAAAQGLRQRLAFAARQQLTTLKNRLAVAVRTLDTVSPLATLDRGYAILTDAISGTVLISIQTIKPGQPLHARLADGRLLARVEEITKKDEN